MYDMAIEQVENYLLALQNNICHALETEDATARFKKESWQREEGGGGLTCVLEGGDVIEKCGVNFSHVWGERLPSSASASRPDLAGHSFNALGVSLVIHPRNPFAPTAHFNIRFFLTEQGNAEPKWWFGGGFDLTPYYGFVEDCIHWHKTAKKACDPYGEKLYPAFKRAADQYFYLKHRQEPRGIGGIFFDDFNEVNFDHSFAFMRSVGDHFLQAYLPILQRRKNHSYGQRERDFQLYRRGRYVEFNLLYDRGTLFGLQSGGRTESILISLPPAVAWRYDWNPSAGSAEEKLHNEYFVHRNWVEE